uniref:Uncharacterized protein n=1 Tax=Anguilla anguilla TaxID=7936 RepID=A0A0E9PT42_ANGAN
MSSQSVNIISGSDFTLVKAVFLRS